jgi:hypothetical protein
MDVTVGVITAVLLVILIIISLLMWFEIRRGNMITGKFCCVRNGYDLG